MGSTRSMPEQLADQLLHQTACLGPFCCLFSYFFAYHEHFDSLKTPILTRCPNLLSLLRVLSSCLFHDPVFALINVPTMRDAVISCSHLLSSLSHLGWDEVTLTRGRRCTTSAESGRLLPFRRVFELFFVFLLRHL